MKAYSCCSGGVMFVEDGIERGTNKEKSKAKSYKDIVGDDAQKKPMREKIFGVFFKNDKASKVA